MKCEEAKEKALEYVMGFLSGEEKEEMEKHLETCRECRRLADTLFAEEAFIKAVVSRLAMKRSILPAVMRRKEPVYTRFWGRLGIAAGAIAAVILLGLLFMPFSTATPPPVADAKLIDAEGVVSVHPPLPAKVLRYRGPTFVEPSLAERVKDEGTD